MAKERGCETRIASEDCTIRFSFNIEDEQFVFSRILKKIEKIPHHFFSL